LRLVREFQAALDADETSGQIIRRELLRRIGRREVGQVLDDHGLPAFEVGQARRVLTERPLYAVERALKALKMLKHQILDLLSHTASLSGEA
jgi:hypothetical protein